MGGNEYAAFGLDCDPVIDGVVIGWADQVLRSGAIIQKRIRALTRDNVNYYRRLRHGQDHAQVEAGLGITRAEIFHRPGI